MAERASRAAWRKSETTPPEKDDLGHSVSYFDPRPSHAGGGGSPSEVGGSFSPLMKLLEKVHLGEGAPHRLLGPPPGGVFSFFVSVSILVVGAVFFVCFFVFIYVGCIFGIWGPLRRRPDSMKDPLAKVHLNVFRSWAVLFLLGGFYTIHLRD